MTITALPQSAAPPTPTRRRRRIPESAPQALVWVLVAVLVIGPLAPLVYASLRSKPYYLPGGVFTLDPYRTLFADPAFWHATRNTLIFAGMATTLAVVLGAGLAVLCSRTDMPGSRSLGALVLAPIVIPPLGLIVGWVSIYGQSGYATGLVSRDLHLPVWNLSSLPGMAVLGATVATPVAYLTCRAALTAADGALEQAALAAGAGPLRVIRHITLPMLRPAILNSGLLIFALSLEVLGIPLFLGPPANIDFYSSYLYHTWSSGTVPDPPQVAAGAVILLVVVTLLMLARGRLLGAEQRFTAAALRGGSARPPLQLGRWRRPTALVVGAYLTVTSIVPILGLALMSGVRALTTLVAPWHLWTAANWQQVTSDPSVRRSITNSLLIAVVGGAVSVLLVAVAALVAHRSRFALRRSLPSLLMYPRAVPGIVLGIGFFWLFLMVNVPGAFLRNSIWGEMLALCARNITLAYVVIAPSLARINAEFDRAARASGAGWWTTARAVLLPMLRPALLAAFVLMFVTLLGDYDPVVFLQKPGTEVMGVTMLQIWERGAVGPVAALALIQVVIVALVLAAGAKAVKGLRHA